MLDIVALSYNELPPVVPVRGSIPDEGGTIGRDSENTLVLPDPARLVSRKHGRFVREGDGYVIANVSDGNSFFVNERDVPAGAKCPLVDGDLLQIGGYVLRIRLSTGQVAGVPAKATSGELNTRRAGPAPVPVVPPAAPSRKAPVGTPPAASLPGPFDDLLGAPVAPPKELFRQANENLEMAGPVEVHIIPADFDPFGEMPQRKEALGPLGAVGSSEDGSSDDGLSEDGLSEVIPKLSPFSVVADDPDISGGRRESLSLPDGIERCLTTDPDTRDPLELFKDESRGNSLLDSLQIGLTEMPSMDLAPELTAAFRAPKGSPLEPDDSSRGSEVETAHADSVEIPVRSEPTRAESLSGRTAQTAANVPAATPTEDNPDCPGMEDVAVESSPSLRRMSAGSEVCSDSREELRRAFEAGLQAKLPEQSMDFNVDTLRMIGALLRIALVGTLDLMRARSAVKREVRVEMTVIEPNDNNPLKLSPDVDIAIQYLFGRKYPGFLGPIEAMTEAYSDVTSHQMGMVAGMRSAMEDMIHRFDPAKIEAESAAKGVLSRISRAHGRSDCWEAYCARYQGIADALGNDFQDFYAQAFIRAYEEEIAGRAKIPSST